MRDLDHKAAGHDGLLTEAEGALVFKPYNAVEAQFYMDTVARRAQEEDVHGDVPFYRWIPCYLGTLEQGDSRHVSVNYNGRKFIVLNNIIHGFSKPNIMDIKLGAKLYDDDASEDKKERMKRVSNMTTSGSLSFRICGMKIERTVDTCSLDKEHFAIEPQNDDVTYLSVNKMFGRTRTKENIKEAIEFFFDNHRLSQLRKYKLYQQFWQRLQLLYNTLLDTEARFISSSLLFVYESDPAVWDELDDEEDLIHDYEDDMMEEDQEDSTEPVEMLHSMQSKVDSDDSENDVFVENKEIPKKLSSLTMIDFAHSKYLNGAGYDENSVQGVENLINIFNELCDK
ncbi:Uncharacterized protein RNJ44_00142 [Nakaseomyces bracarensis]|uniref:Kinase n=1 Tax=Nakaseomyces bracarensis TaxID=273131 RepID=A0ABR4NT05_9SACH